MVGFATIFDRESHRIGFALSTCQCKFKESNIF